jgi:hypothetical protein
MPATLRKQITRKRAAWTGLRARITPAAFSTATPERR